MPTWYPTYAHVIEASRVHTQQRSQLKRVAAGLACRIVYFALHLLPR